MQAAKEKTVSNGEVLPQAKTRVRGIPLENANGIGPHWPANSTLIWGWSPFYDGTASGQLDQRYYASGSGRFITPDPYQASGGADDPGSWNRYAYVQGDPVNFKDPHGLMIATGDFCNPSIWPSTWDTPECDPGGGDEDVTFYTCMAPMGFTRIPGVACFAMPAAAAVAAKKPPVITLRAVDSCALPDGTGLNPGKWTLAVKYQVLVDGEVMYGNNALNESGIAIYESVNKTSGNIDIGNGRWCPAGGRCDTAGSMSSSGTFWDLLASFCRETGENVKCGPKCYINRVALFQLYR